MVCELYLNLQKNVLKGKTLITRGTAATLVLKESSSEVREGVGWRLLWPDAASPNTHRPPPSHANLRPVP